MNLSTGTVGDVIVEANGKPVRCLSDLTDEIEQIGVGNTVRLTVLRGSERRTVKVAIVDITG